MIKKILLVTLWTVTLPVCASFIVILVCIAYLKVTLHGANPGEQTRDTVETIWTYAFQITQLVAMLLGVFGRLPGTRLRPNSPSPSRSARWCYRVAVAALLVDWVISIFSHAAIWDGFAIMLLICILAIALVDKYTGRTRTPVNETPLITGK